MRNPFTVSFGKKPYHYIGQDFIMDEMLAALESEPIQDQCFMLTGVRGSGKTVMLTAIENQLREDKNWLVIGINAERDMLQSLAAKLYDSNRFLKDFFRTSINLTAFGIGVEVENQPPVADLESALEKILKEMKRKKKRLLVTIDEVYNSKYVREFAQTFQLLIRQDLPIFLVMAGLYDNIHRLEDEKTLTFLYRAPKYHMMPLNLNMIQNSYQQTFRLPEEKAREMAELTKGYPFAYQALGKYVWDSPGHEVTEDVLFLFDQTLAGYVYDKIWNELSEKDRWYLSFLTEEEKVATGIVLERSHTQKNEFSQYRSRLQNKGLIDTSQRGFLSLRLPRFAEYIRSKQ